MDVKIHLITTHKPFNCNKKFVSNKVSTQSKGSILTRNVKELVIKSESLRVYLLIFRKIKFYGVKIYMETYESTNLRKFNGLPLLYV